MAEIYEHKKKLYAITDQTDTGFIVIKSSLLPDGKKLVEEMRRMDVKNMVAVKRAIRTGKYETFEEI